MEQKECILIVDADPAAREAVQDILVKAGFGVVLVESGLAAVEILLQRQVDLVLLDVMVPALDGIQTCRRIRQFSEIPVIFLTRPSEEEALVEGFSAGAQDYITKPFRPQELVVRIRAALQRSASRGVSAGPRLVYLELELDPRLRVVRKAGVALKVTPMSYRLIQYFMYHLGEVVSKSDLLRDVWGYADLHKGNNRVEAAIKRLRKDLQDDPCEPRYLKTLWGMGYRFGEKKHA